MVVKPARGEQGAGITVGVTRPEDLDRAIELAAEHSPDVLLEERCDGEDLRIVVINGKVIAAALRRPPEVVGSGEHTIRQLVEAQSRRRAAATHGESIIPVDDLTEDTVREAGCELDDVLPLNEHLIVRRTANLHTGGTIRDVTDDLNPTLAKVAVDAADAIGIPVTGIDLIVPSVDGRGVRLHRGQRASRAGQSRTAARPRRRSWTYSFRAPPRRRGRGNPTPSSRADARQATATAPTPSRTWKATLTDLATTAAGCPQTTAAGWSTRCSPCCRRRARRGARTR